MIRPALLLVAVLAAVGAHADDERARLNYALHCQGCHLPDATGLDPDVPRMTGFVGNFLHSQAGREFVIRVPGVATAALNDADLAELVNWLLVTFSPNELPAGFEPYTAEEVAALRTDVEQQPQAVRARILADMSDTDTGR